MESKQLAWYHFKFMIPSDWEVTAYSVEDRAGRLEFSTRHGFQSVIEWESCKHEPETETMMLAFLRKGAIPAERANSLSILDIKTASVGPFLVGHIGEGEPCQAIAYLKEEKKILHWIFNGFSEFALKSQWFPILESFRPNDADRRQFAVYGMDFMLPKSYELGAMVVLPANVRITFKNDRKVSATFRRWGMPDLVLNGRSLDTFHPWFLRTQGCTVGEVKNMTVCHMPATRITYEKRGEHQMDRYMGRPWKGGEAWLWHDIEQKRIYAFEQIGPPGSELLPFSEVFPQLT